MIHLLKRQSWCCQGLWVGQSEESLSPHVIRFVLVRTSNLLRSVVLVLWSALRSSSQPRLNKSRRNQIDRPHFHRKTQRSPFTHSTDHRNSDRGLRIGDSRPSVISNGAPTPLAQVTLCIILSNDCSVELRRTVDNSRDMIIMSVPTRQQRSQTAAPSCRLCTRSLRPRQ